MSRPMHAVLTIAALGLVACTDAIPTSGNSLALNEAFQTIPVGFSSNSNSFDPSSDAGMPFYPGALSPSNQQGGRMGQGGQMGHGGRAGPAGQGGQGDRQGSSDRGDGFGHGTRGLMMGGGLGPEFIGVMGFGPRHGRGPFGTFDLPDTCTFDDTTDRVVCPDVTRNGLTISRSYAFETLDGTAQEEYDSATTDLVNVRTRVDGTRTRADAAATSTVLHTSDRTIAGLSSGSTERTINGESFAHETTTGTRDGVGFTAERLAGDTTTKLVVPIVEGRPTIPSSGTVIRAMKVTITPAGGTATTHERRELITFDGTNVVSVTITQDGVTRTCTITLPGRRLVCD